MCVRLSACVCACLCVCLAVCVSVSVRLRVLVCVWLAGSLLVYLCMCRYLVAYLRVSALACMSFSSCAFAWSVVRLFVWLIGPVLVCGVLACGFVCSVACVCVLVRWRMCLFGLLFVCACLWGLVVRVCFCLSAFRVIVCLFACVCLCAWLCL